MAKKLQTHDKKYHMNKDKAFTCDYYDDKFQSKKQPHNQTIEDHRKCFFLLKKITNRIKSK